MKHWLSAEVRRYGCLLAVLGTLFLLPRALQAQAGCTGLPCNNPVPCAQCTGAWNDGTGVTWTVTSNSSDQVSGIAVLKAPVGSGCQDVTYTVSGYISRGPIMDGYTGVTSFTWNATSPSPGGTCGTWTPATYITNSGTINNNSCSKGTGTWRDNIGSGSFIMTKTSDMPWGETTSAVGFSVGIYATIGQFRETLQHSLNLNGRQVLEAAYGSSTDTCYFPGSAVPPYQLSGGVWNVGYWPLGPSVWGDDYIGYPTPSVSYYRQAFRIPCSTSIAQTMRIGVTSGGSQDYKTHTIGITLPDYQRVTAIRDGVSQTTIWQ